MDVRVAALSCRRVVVCLHGLEARAGMWMTWHAAYTWEACSNAGTALIACIMWCLLIAEWLTINQPWGCGDSHRGFHWHGV